MINLRMGLIVFLLLINAGCSHLDGYLDITENKGVSNAYLTMLNEWTRKEHIYSQFETRATIITTYKSNAFMNGYLNEYTRIYNLTDAEKRRRVEIQQGFSKQSMELLLYSAMPDKETNDFDKANSIWNISLLDEKGKRHEPIEIRRIEKVSTIMEAFFPFINKYHGMCYTVKFSPSISGEDFSMTAKKSIKVIYTSVIGRIEQSWP